MRRVEPAPIKDRIDLEDKAAGISEPWRKYFDGLSRSSAKYDSRTYTGDAVLKTSDFGKVIKMDTGGGGTLTCYLPSVATGNIDSWVVIMRLGTGTVIIKAPDYDTIENSRAGGEVVCKEVGRVAANLHLFLVTETKWAILGGTGKWEVY